MTVASKGCFRGVQGATNINAAVCGILSGWLWHRRHGNAVDGWIYRLLTASRSTPPLGWRLVALSSSWWLPSAFEAEPLAIATFATGDGSPGSAASACNPRSVTFDLANPADVASWHTRLV